MVTQSERPQELDVSEFKRYLNFPILLWYYKEINKADSSHSDVDAFYLNFLLEIFKIGDGFAMEQEPLTARQLISFKAPHFIIRCIRNLECKKVILYEMQNMNMNEEPQTAIWTKALEKMVECARLIRTEQGQNLAETLYLTVNIGTYIRFYELPGASTTPKDWEPAKGGVYELANNEEEIWGFWHQIRDLIMIR